ncbi:MAG: lipid A export permease/ATP-binding protein MsbA [Acidaminococcaceae bacterium]|nr:lipid A export permease/ATP-binding protein MsbA [Acidaminococcaceae bacterium]
MILYKRILRYIKPYLHVLFAALLCTMLAAAGNLYLPWIFRDMIDKVLTAKDAYMLNMISASIVVIFFLRGIFLYGQNYLMSWVGQRVIIDIRAEVFRKLQRLSMSFYDRNKTGTIMSYVTNDVSALQGAMVDNTVELVTESIILIGSVCAMIYLDWKLTLFTILTFPVVLFFMNFFGKKIRRSGGQIQEAAADITSVLQESVSSARVVKSFVREQYEIERFERENEANLKANLKNAKYMATLTPTIEFVAALGVTMILWYGGNNVIDGETTAGSLVAFLAYAVNISNPIKRITRTTGTIQRALAAAQRVFDVLDLPEEVQDLPDAKELPAVTGSVRFEHVSFSYNEGDEILHDLSFEAKPGQAVGLVGPSGAGKSTIASLLPRFYDCDGGTIRIDGKDIKHVTLDSLRNQVGIVPQETILFNGTVYDNILYGRLDATKEEIEAAAKAANAHDFIMELPEGYNTNLGDRGVNISGGQRQRIAIARAILKDPRILVLDEATSALDTESERVVQEALNRLMVGRTSIIIAHRLSTIKNADRILVLDKGKLVEDGTHDELMEKNGLYAHLYQIQYRNNQEES